MYCTLTMEQATPYEAVVQGEDVTRESTRWTSKL
jgi:hypothetical protein